MEPDESLLLRYNAPGGTGYTFGGFTSTAPTRR